MLPEYKEWNHAIIMHYLLLCYYVYLIYLLLLCYYNYVKFVLLFMNKLYLLINIFIIFTPVLSISFFNLSFFFSILLDRYLVYPYYSLSLSTYLSLSPSLSLFLSLSPLIFFSTIFFLTHLPLSTLYISISSLSLFSLSPSS